MRERLSFWVGRSWGLGMAAPRGMREASRVSSMTRMTSSSTPTWEGLEGGWETSISAGRLGNEVRT